jgi:hypothetical protein
MAGPRIKSEDDPAIHGVAPNRRRRSPFKSANPLIGPAWFARDVHADRRARQQFHSVDGRVRPGHDEIEVVAIDLVRCLNKDSQAGQRMEHTLAARVFDGDIDAAAGRSANQAESPRRRHPSRTTCRIVTAAQSRLTLNVSNTNYVA